MEKNIWFDKNILRASAFRSLSKWSMLIYLDFLRKRQMAQIKSKSRSGDWIIKNNGEIVYPYVEAEKKGIGRREFRNAIDELMVKGFLDIAHQGSGGRSGDMTRFVIDDRWKDYDSPSFRPAKNPRRKDTRKGRGWSAFQIKKEKFSVTKLILKKAASSDKSVTSSGESPILSSNGSDTPKTSRNKTTSQNNSRKIYTKQQCLWSNNNDTIL